MLPSNDRPVISDKLVNTVSFILTDGLPVIALGVHVAYKGVRGAVEGRPEVGARHPEEEVGGDVHRGVAGMRL